MKKRPLYTLVAGTAFAAAACFVVFRPRPARLQVTARAGDDTVIVNQTHLTRLTSAVLDQYGRHLAADTTVRYRWIGGDSMRLAANGEVRCTDRRDARVRASLGSIVKDFELRCRPVTSIEAASWIDLVVGDSTRDLSFVAHGPDGRPETELRGAVTLSDGSVVAAKGTTIRPKRSGQAWASVQIGDVKADIPIVVYEPVTTFVSAPHQMRLMAMRVNLARGDTIVVPLPKAAFWVTYFSTNPSVPPPTIELRGEGSCTTGDGVRQRRIEEGEYAKYCLARDGARLMVAHGAGGAASVRGVVALRLIW